MKTGDARKSAYWTYNMPEVRWLRMSTGSCGATHRHAEKARIKHFSHRFYPHMKSTLESLNACGIIE